MDKKGKTQLIILSGIILVLLFGVFVLAQENNSLTYSNNDLTITIKNSLNQKLGEATLSSHSSVNEVRHVWGGKDRVVMWYDFNGWSSAYSNGLGEVTFTDMNSGEEVIKDYYFAKRIFYQECVETGSVLNGSLRTVCTEKERWDKLSENDIPAGNTRIGLITDVNKGDFYDGVWTIAGIKIERHAQWDYTGDTFAIDGGSGMYDMTLIDNNNSLLIVDRSFHLIRKYFLNNESSGGTFDISTQTTGPTGICSDQTYLWIGNDGTDVDKYSLDFTYIGTWSTSSQTNNIRGMAYCQNTIFVGDNNNQRVYKYFTNGTYKSSYLDLKGENSLQSTLTGLDCDGNYLWASGFGGQGDPAYSGETYKYWLNGTYTGIVSNAVAVGNAGARASVTNGTFYYRNDYEDNLIYIYKGWLDITPPEITSLSLNSTDGTNRSNQDLNCVFTLTDDEQTTLTIYWKWYKNDILNLSGSKNISNNSLTTLTLLSGNTTKNDNWTCEILPSDWYNNGTVENSSSIWVLNTEPDAPVQLTPANASGYGMASIVPFKWENSNDEDGDSLTYRLEIYNESNMVGANLVYSNNSINQGTGNTTINITLSQYTTKDDDYYWRVLANDGTSNSSWSQNWTFQYANWTITFNAIDSITNISILENSMEISCDNGFSAAGKNPYTSNPDAFAAGTWTCTFSGVAYYFAKEQIFNADSDKTIDISMSSSKGLTEEEHTWLEAIYECIINKNCDLYNLLLEINTTIGNIWEYTAPTDESVITNEIITNKVVNSTNNLTINYSVNIPIKAGYDAGTYLPVRIGYWFLDETNKTCYNQGDKPTGVEEPYCQPLIIETVGQMGGAINFTVELQPSLANGSAYSIKRTIDIDPNNIWINYGQEIIGTFITTESLKTYGANVRTTGESMPGNFISKITGAITGMTNSLLSGWQLVIVIAIIGLILIIFIISRTILKIKGK